MQRFLTIQNLIYTLILAFFTADLVFVWLHLSYAAGYDLDAEGTLPVAYQSVKLILAALLCLAVRIQRPGQNWILLLGGLFAYISLDEWYQIHERVSDEFHKLLLSIDSPVEFAAWLIPYAPLIVVAVAAFYFGYRELFSDKKNDIAGAKKWFIAGVLTFVAVPVFEVLSTWGAEWWTEGYRVSVGIEEGLEMLGVSCFVAALGLVLRKQK